MADEADKELKLRITTAADVRGAEQAEEALDSVKKKASSVTQDQKDAAQAALSDLNRGSGGEWARNILGTGQAAGQASKQLGALKQSGDDVRRVFTGLQQATQGGTTGVIGLTNAFRGLSGIFQRIGSVLLGPVGLGLGAAAAGIAYLGKIAKDKQADIEKFFGKVAEEGAALRSSYAAIEEAAKKSLDAQIERVDKLTADYAELLTAIDANDARLRESIKLQVELKKATLDRDEQRALSGATTDEQRAKISGEAARRRQQIEDDVANAEIINARLKGEAQRDRAAQQQSAAQRELDEAKRNASGARTAADVAKENSEALLQEKGAGSKDAQAAVESAKKAARAADEAEQNLQRIVAKTATTLRQLEQQLAEANANIQRAELGAQTRTLQVETEALKSSNAARPDIKKLRDEAADASAAQDFARQDKAVAGLREIATTVKQATDREKANAAALAGALQQNFAAREAKDELVIKSIEKQTRRDLNSREVAQ